jgi:hypothetical protein
MTPSGLPSSTVRASWTIGRVGALAVALAMGDAFAAQTGLAELKKANLEARLPDARRAEFTELLAAEALVVLHVFGIATAFLLAPHLGETTV